MEEWERLVSEQNFKYAFRKEMDFKQRVLMCRNLGCFIVEFRRKFVNPEKSVMSYFRCTQRNIDPKPMQKDPMFQTIASKAPL